MRIRIYYPGNVEVLHMHLLLSRHGTTKAVQENRFQGGIDVPLDEKGRFEAGLLANRLEALSLQRIYCSPLSRARETAEIVALKRKIPVVKLKHLREFCWGALEGRCREEICKEFPVLARRLEKNFRRAAVPGRESYRHLKGRIRCAWRRILKENSAQSNVLVVGHGYFLNALLAVILGMDFRQDWPFSFSPASLSLVDIREDGSCRMRLFNDTCHLRG